MFKWLKKFLGLDKKTVQAPSVAAQELPKENKAPDTNIQIQHMQAQIDAALNTVDPINHPILIEVARDHFKDLRADQKIPVLHRMINISMVPNGTAMMQEGAAEALYKIHAASFDNYDILGNMVKDRFDDFYQMAKNPQRYTSPKAKALSADFLEHYSRALSENQRDQLFSLSCDLYRDADEQTEQKSIKDFPFLTKFSPINGLYRFKKVKNLFVNSTNPLVFKEVMDFLEDELSVKAGVYGYRRADALNILFDMALDENKDMSLRKDVMELIKSSYTNSYNEVQAKAHVKIPQTPTQNARGDMVTFSKIVSKRFDQLTDILKDENSASDPQGTLRSFAASMIEKCLTKEDASELAGIYEYTKLHKNKASVFQSVSDLLDALPTSPLDKMKAMMDKVNESIDQSNAQIDSGQPDLARLRIAAEKNLKLINEMKKLAIQAGIAFEKDATHSDVMAGISAFFNDFPTKYPKQVTVVALPVSGPVKNPSPVYKVEVITGTTNQRMA